LITNQENKLTRQYILQLSDALRYMIYDTSEELVPLEKEISYLKNYVTLEGLRMDEAAMVQFNCKGDFSGYLIAPLILLPLVENCFKHCNKNEPKITIQINLKGQRLLVQSTNNIAKEETKLEGGLGLKNLKNRLHLIYPNKYQFNNTLKNDFYKSSLAIKLH